MAKIYITTVLSKCRADLEMPGAVVYKERRLSLDVVSTMNVE